MVEILIATVLNSVGINEFPDNTTQKPAVTVDTPTQSIDSMQISLPEKSPVSSVGQESASGRRFFRKIHCGRASSSDGQHKSLDGEKRKAAFRTGKLLVLEDDFPYFDHNFVIM